MRASSSPRRVGLMGGKASCVHPCPPTSWPRRRYSSAQLGAACHLLADEEERGPHVEVGEDIEVGPGHRVGTIVERERDALALQRAASRARSTPNAAARAPRSRAAHASARGRGAKAWAQAAVPTTGDRARPASVPTATCARLAKQTARRGGRAQWASGQLHRDGRSRRGRHLALEPVARQEKREHVLDRRGPRLRRRRRCRKASPRTASRPLPSPWRRADRSPREASPWPWAWAVRETRKRTPAAAGRPRSRGAWPSALGGRGARRPPARRPPRRGRRPRRSVPSRSPRDAPALAGRGWTAKPPSSRRPPTGFEPAAAGTERSASAVTRSSIESQRSSGLFARHRMTTASSPAGKTRPSATDAIGGGGSDTCAIIVARSVRLSNGACPVNIA